MNIICCMRTCFLLTVALVVLSFAAGTTFAADHEFKVGQKKEITLNCTNPAFYEDGVTPLPVEEIESVTVYIDPVYGADPAYHSITMIGGCQQTVIDAKLFVHSVKYQLYGTATATNGLTSVLSDITEGDTFTMTPQHPGKPTGLKAE